MYIKDLPLILLFIFLSQIVTAQAGWEKYVSDMDASFSIEAPSKLISKFSNAETSLGEFPTMIYALEGNSDDLNKLYQINQIDYPEGSFPTDSTDLMKFYLSSAIDNTMYSLEGSLVYSNDLSHLGDAAKLFRISYNDGKAIVKGKCLIYRDTYYMLTVYSHKDDSLNSDMDYFLNSFELLD